MICFSNPGGALDLILTGVCGPDSKSRKWTLEIAWKIYPYRFFFQETIPLQILTKTFSLFSPLVLKSTFSKYLFIELVKIQKKFVPFPHNSTLTLKLHLSPSQRWLYYRNSTKKAILNLYSCNIDKDGARGSSGGVQGGVDKKMPTRKQLMLCNTKVWGTKVKLCVEIVRSKILKALQHFDGYLHQFSFWKD